MNIGIFDSGLGGLSIFKEIIKELPQYNYIYLGDNARVPYGNRTSETIYQFTKNAVDFLMKKNCSLIILACNTATSSALRRIQREYLPKNYPQRRVLGIILPMVETVTENPLKKIGVIGTRATINSKSYLAEFKKISPKLQIFQQVCPLLVPIIEEGKLDWQGLDLILEEYLTPLKRSKIEALILGCTHYSLIANKIQKIIGKEVKVFPQGKATALKLKSYLKHHSEIKKNLAKNSKRQYFVTDLNKQYKKLVKFFLGKEFKDNKLKLVQI